LIQKYLTPALVLLTLWLFYRPWRPVHAQSEATRLDPTARRLLIRCGITDKSGKSWTGALEPESGAQELSLEGYHFQPPDEIAASGRFSFATRPWASAVQQVDLSPIRPGLRVIFPNGVYASVKGPSSARFRLSINGATHGFALADLAGGKILSFDGGNIEAQLEPNEQQLSGTEGQADFPAVAAGPTGKAAVVWQEFLQDRDRIVVREFDGAAWLAAETFELPETRDIFRSAAAYDGAGSLHVIWSAQVDANWDLYERRKTGQGWSAVERLTTAAGSDFNHKVIADASGNLWLAWQAFRNGQSDIYLKRYSAGAWGPETQVSSSAADDWEPALAAAPDGTVWVGWDSYDRGNYDIFVRPFKNGQPGPIQQITKSPRFEAHVSLAADAQSRLWIGFDEAEANWGKDYGYLVKDRGNPLYQSRRIRLVRLSGGKLEEPAAPLAEAFPLGTPEFLQYPQLSISPDGALTVLAMQLTHADQVIEVWGVRGVWGNVAFTLDGSGWKPNQDLPRSNGANDIRAALAPGSAWAAWASDGRNFATGAPQRQTVHAARLLPSASEAREISTKPFVEEPELSFPTHAAEAANLKTARGYRIRSGGKEYHILRGDLHRHTSLSPDGVGDGSLWDLYRYVLDAAQMDYSSVTDHQAGGTEYNWWKTQKSADLFQTPGRLTTLYAYERSVLYPNGHRNIVLPKRGAPILPIAPGENQGTIRSADSVLPYLRKYNAIAFRHTIATNQGTDWKDHNNELEPLVEIYQGHRVVYEHEGGPKGATAEKLYMQRSGYQPAGFFWNALAKGYRMGIQASSDHCSTHLSYACILVENSSREALIDAMRKRHTYGATDNIVLDFRVKADGKEYLQGDAVETKGRYTLTFSAIGTGPIRRIDVIHNESYAYSVTPTGKSTASFSYTDPQPAAGENRYYVRLEQEDGALAWSSPVWIER
jgi:hypothetical protein